MRVLLGQADVEIDKHKKAPHACATSEPSAEDLTFAYARSSCQSAAVRSCSMLCVSRSTVSASLACIIAPLRRPSPPAGQALNTHVSIHDQNNYVHCGFECSLCIFVFKIELLF